MLSREQLIQEVHRLVESNIGTYGAKRYQEHIKDLEYKEILMSVQALLVELVGAKDAEKQMTVLRSKLDSVDKEIT